MQDLWLGSVGQQWICPERVMNSRFRINSCGSCTAAPGGRQTRPSGFICKSIAALFISPQEHSAIVVEALHPELGTVKPFQGLPVQDGDCKKENSVTIRGG
jgi:hypothetical protein